MNCRICNCLMSPSVLIALSCGLVYVYSIAEQREADLWWSNITPLEKEISYRTEQGLYYSYYKELVNSPNLLEGLTFLLSDNKTEGPSRINIYWRMNILPEVFLAILYKVLPVGEAIDFYNFGLVLLQAFTPISMCLVTWQITESWTAAYLYAAVFVLNQYEVSRATFALPLRENFALPLWWIRQLSVTLFLKRSYHFSTPGSQKVKILVSLWTSTALFCMFWQFSPFALLLEAMAMTVLHQMSLITDAQCFTLSAIGLLALVCAFASQAGNIFPLASPCAAVLLTNLIWITTKRCYVARYRHSEKPNNEGVLENANPRCGGKCGIICVALCRTLFMALLYSVIMFAFPNEDATHIRLYVREKLNIFPKWNFHTALYLCNEAFRGMDVLDFINGSIAGFGWNVLFYFLGMTALLPWKKLKLCHALRRRLSRLFHIQKQMKDTMSEQQLNKKIKTERGMTICRTWCAAMNITFGVLAWNMLRMKYLWTPHLLFVLTYGVYIFIWSGTQLLLSFIDIVLNKFWKRTVSKTAAIQMKKSQGSSNTKPTGPANTEKMRFWRRLIVGIGLFALANASVFQAYKRLTGRLESLREFYDPDTVELMQWIKNNTDKNALFAGSMQLMAGVKLCSDRPIANHPHYENRRLRERTVQIYQIYGRQSEEQVHQLLTTLSINYIILEDSICFAPSDGCAERDLVDINNNQACTGISDVAYSLALLEAHDWDLTGAVTSALADGVADTDVDVSHLAPGSNQAQPSPYSPVTASVELDDRHPRSRTNSGSRPPRSPRRPSRSPGGSRSRTSISQTEPSRDVVEMDTAPVGSTGHVRILHFEIRLELPWGGSSGSTDICSECFTFPETETVRSLKRYFVEHRLAEMIQLATSPEWASEIPDVTPNSLIEHLDFQHTGTHNFSDDSVTLRTLHLPKFNTIDAKLKHTIAKRESTPRIASLAHIEINIHIKNPDSDPNMDMNDGNVRPLRLQPGWRVSQLRHDASSLTGIPVNRQIWSEAPKESGSNGVIARLVEELNNIPGVTSKKSAGRGVCESPSLTDLGLRSDGVYNLFLEEAPSKSSSHVSTRITANPPAAGFSIQSTAHVSSPSCESEMETESRSEQPSTSKRTTSRKQSSQPKMGKTLPNDRVSDIEDDLDYDDDAEDRYSSDEAVDQFKSAPWSTPLIPDTHYGDDPGKATEQFCQVFLQRYCGDGAAMAPPFATCSLDAALAASAGTPTVSERKPLFIYLHNDESVACHVFCQQILCSTGLGQFLGDNGFCLWPWDVTAPRSRERLLGWLENKLPNLATIVTPLSVDSYPVLAMVGKLAGQLEVLCVVLGTGAVTGPIQRKPDDLSFPPLGSPERRLMKPFPTETSGSLKPDVIVAELWQAYTTYTELLAPELAAEAERLARQRVREEQEAAYRESLRKDKQKAIERAAAEELERLEKERVEAQKRSEKNKATQRRLAMAASLPSEPPAPNTPALNAFLATSRGSAGIASLRFRLPRDRTSAPSAASGSNETPNSTLARRFAGLDVLKDVFAFVESQGFPISDYKVLTSYPRRDLTTLDENETLADLKLVPQETLTLEQR